MSRKMKGSSSPDKEDWIKCGECGVKVRYVFLDNSKCYCCDKNVINSKKEELDESY